MFIKKITIKNFRLFPSNKNFEIDDIATPDGVNPGSGLNIFVGENGCGKTTLLDAFSLPLLEYKSENFGIDNFNDPTKEIEISIYSHDEFTVTGTMPNNSFKAKGFLFKANLRSKENKAYLSSIVVNDQLFIKVDPLKPKDGSPDLRVNVNNPFKGKRFNDNDVVFLDKNRIYQTRTGNFNTTRFDRLMEDFNYQYLNKSGAGLLDLNSDLDVKIKQNKIKNNFLWEAIKKFQDISGFQLKLDFLDNYGPFKNAFFASKKGNLQQINLSNLGSGYEMIFALLYSFYLAQQSGKQLIIIIDEPELHLHPMLQKKFVDFLIEFSKNAQIIIASHSSLLIKQISENDKARVRILENDGQKVSEIKTRVLPYISANETNFLAFNLATEEYHNELYSELEDRFWDNPKNNLKTLSKNDHYNQNKSHQVIFDNEFFVNDKKELKNSSWKKEPGMVSIHTFIRNQIHHQKDNGKTEYGVLKESIEKLRTFF